MAFWMLCIGLAQAILMVVQVIQTGLMMRASMSGGRPVKTEAWRRRDWRPWWPLGAMALLALSGWVPYILDRESRQAAIAGSTGLVFVQWFVAADDTSCNAVIDATQIPNELREQHEIALICGLADASVDPLKDDQITISRLFTPQHSVAISAPFSRAMSEALSRGRASAVKRGGFKTGERVDVTQTIWFKAVLLPRGTEPTNIHRLADVLQRGGHVADINTAIGIRRMVVVGEQQS